MKKITHILGIFSLVTFISCAVNTSQSQSSSVDKTPVVDSKEEETVENVPIGFMEDKGIGPVKSLRFSESINEEMANAGKILYNQMCSACHKIDVNFIGPAPKGVFDRRSPEWVMNMILNPQEMLEKNDTAKALLEEYNNAPMADMGLNEEQARSILEYFRTL